MLLTSVPTLWSCVRSLIRRNKLDSHGMRVRSTLHLALADEAGTVAAQPENLPFLDFVWRA